MDQLMRGFDFYPKTLDDVRVRTLPGAMVSLVASFSILYLVYHEFQAFLTLKTDSSM